MELKFTVTNDEMKLIGAALAELPLKTSFALFTKLQNQIDAQVAPKDVTTANQTLVRPE